MGAREPRASPLRPRPPPPRGSPELRGGGGRGRPRPLRTPVRAKGHCPGEGGTPGGRTRGGGSGASGGRRPGHAERPEGQVSRWHRPGGGVRAKVPRRRRARPTRGVLGPLGAGEGGDGGDRRGGAGALRPPGSGDPGRGRGARPITPACGLTLRPLGAGGTRRGKGLERWGQCQDRQVHAAHCGAGRSPSPATPRHPRVGRVSAEMSRAAIIRWCARSCGRH